MTAEEMWAAFTAKSGINGEYDAWSFGSDPDGLAKLVRNGKKTATASAYDLYALENEPLPAQGQYSVVLWEDASAACIIQTTKVYTVPFSQVSVSHAYKEGEGNRSLAYWLQVHRDFFTQELRQAGLKFTEDTKVVCEEFVRVYP